MSQARSAFLAQRLRDSLGLKAFVPKRGDVALRDGRKNFLTGDFVIE
ncbi:MAG: hypothetical protein HYT94_01330 [Parcubacteria group bacterium]|nr:hypothetical protein [Parcubacteria group bacterium]